MTSWLRWLRERLWLRRVGQHDYVSAASCLYWARREEWR
jgi:hypothetical protein